MAIDKILTKSPWLAEPENIEANHLEFTKSLFQHYCQHLELNHNHISAESAFNFYVNEKIAYLLGTLTNTKSARETFYSELIQNTSLPTNHNFVSIITEINKEIEHYTQQRYPITYANKGREKLQTSAIDPIAKPLQQPLQSPQQPFQQPQQQLQPPQQQNVDPMTYAPIAKLDNFTGKEDDAQVWLNDVEKAIAANGWNNVRAMQAIPYFLKNTADSWYQSLINKLQDFNTFKLEFLRYFSNNNSINWLANIFSTIKQGETEAVTTYLGHFHQNLHQIQAIDINYFTAPQILNQFICGLHNSILQHVYPLHPGTFQDAVTCTRDFESVESKVNHAQAVNLVINGSSDLDSKLKQLSNSIDRKLEEYLANNYTIYQPSQ
ncbi:hypothetical protein G9A89_005483 [Geosiphon pyriformis]|nr:hypothetical protein G9A89_005483 [Geosiphon pyriformis]